jgi:hypothetical protein
MAMIAINTIGFFLGAAAGFASSVITRILAGQFAALD